MARQISVTVTCGLGSEKHNHDLKYREGLDHTNTADSPDAIIELIPYRAYKDKINELVKPYIDEYNEKQQTRYEAAWERYNSGQIKTKPRKSNYKPMDYDYYEAHKNDMQYNRAKKVLEPAKIWRSLILGLGDQEDRLKERITEAEAVSTFKGVIDKWETMFPDFKLLGASIHLDEQGFYHCHVDYMPLFESNKEVKQEHGIRVSNSQEAALEHMGYKPEQSIINGRDKVPIRFNAFRNRLYREIEEGLNDHKINLQYGVSKIKEPDKDGSVNQRLEIWQATQDSARELQVTKNTMRDIIDKNDLGEADYEKAAGLLHRFLEKLKEVYDKKFVRVGKNAVVPFSLFDQLKSFAESLAESIAQLFRKNEELNRKYNDEREKSRKLELENEDLSRKNKKMTNELEDLRYSPSEDFIQEVSRRDIRERYDALLERNIGRQELINREMSRALYAVEKEFDDRPMRQQVIEKDDIEPIR